MKRLLSIDFLRGLVVLLMTFDHARDVFSTVAISSPMGTDLPASYYFIRWITHFCAPTFGLLAGLSMALRPLAGNKALDRPLQIMMIKRGIFIMLLTGVIGIFWTVLNSSQGFVFDCGAIWAIGAGMVFVGLIMNWNPWLLGALSLAMLAGHPYLSQFDQSDSVLWAFLHVPKQYILIKDYLVVNISYPLLPWFGIVGLGYVMGQSLFAANAAFADKRKPFLISLGVVCLVLFMVLRSANLYGDPNLFVSSATSDLKTIMSFLDVTKYPLSFLFALATFPITFFILAFTDSAFFEKPNRLVVWISQYGQAALFYYLLHFFIILFYGYVFSFAKGAYLSTTVIMGVLTILTAYPLIRLFTRIRHQYKEKYPILAYF